MKNGNISGGRARGYGEGVFSKLLWKIARNCNTEKIAKKEKKFTRPGHAKLKDEDVMLIRVLSEHYWLKTEDIEVIYPDINNIRSILAYTNYSKVYTPERQGARLLLGDKLTEALKLVNKARG